MGARNYRGPVTTVDEARQAGEVVTIICQSCDHWTTMWAYKVWEKARARAATMKLGAGHGGFQCKWCKRSVSVLIERGMR